MLTMLMPLLIAFSGFAVVFLVLYVGMQMFREFAYKQSVLDKIQNSATLDEIYIAGASSSESLENRTGPATALLKAIGRRFAPEGTPKYTVLRNEFLKAGIRSPLAIPVFWGLKLLLLISLPLFFSLIRLTFFKLMDPVASLGIYCGLACAGMYAPDIWLRLRIAARKDRIFRGLPDALDMMVVCVEAGLGLDAAVNRVAEEIQLSCKDLSDELRLYRLEMLAGCSRQDALKNLMRRTELEEIQNLVNLLLQTDRFGTSLAQGLRVYSESFRTRRFIKAEEKAATLPTKLMLPVLFFIFPALFVVIALPAAIRIYQAFVK